MRSIKRIVVLSVFSLSLACVLLYFRINDNSSKELTIGCFTNSEWGIPDRDFNAPVEKAIEIFHERYPDIEIKYQSGIRESDYSEWLMEGFVEGTEPDVFLVRHDDLYSLETKGALQSLNYAIRNDKDISSTDYYPALIDREKTGNEIYGLPYMCDPVLMAVNKNIINAIGIEDHGDTWTWGDFHTACRLASVYTDKDEHYFGFSGYNWKMAAISNGAHFFNADGSENYLNSKEVSQAVNYFYRIKNKMTVEEDFYSGKVAFSPMKASEYRRNTTSLHMMSRFSDFDWYCKSMPAGPSGDNISETELLSAAISSRSGNKKAAWEFLKILCGDIEVQKAILENTAALPTKKNVIKSAGKDYGKTDFDMLDRVLDKAQVPCRFIGYEDLVIKMDSAVEKAIDSSQDLDSALQDAHRSIS